MLPNRSIKAVIWDCGGVLVSTADDSGRRAWEQKLRLPLHDLDRIVLGSETWIQVQCGTLLEEDYWTDVGTQLNLDQKAVQALRHDFYAGDRVDPILIDVITHLRPGYKQAVLSNAPASLLETLRDHYHVSQLFDVIIASAWIKVMKPDPRAYRAVLEALGLRAEETVFVDDLLQNIDAAKKLGMHTIHFETENYDVRPLLSAVLGGVKL